MTPFASVSHVHLGCNRFLRSLHRDEIRQMREAPAEERERHAERASRLREMMDHMDLLRTVGCLAR